VVCLGAALGAGVAAVLIIFFSTGLIGCLADLSV